MSDEATWQQIGRAIHLLTLAVYKLDSIPMWTASSMQPESERAPLMLVREALDLLERLRVQRLAH